MTRMNAPVRSIRPPCAPPAPIAASAAACIATPDGTGGAADRRRSRRIRRISAGCARRARRSARRSGSTAGCCIRCCGRPTARSRASTGTRARSRRRRLRPHHRARRAGRGRLLSLRPAADRGLLRRQQADEGLHRHGQRRHQFAAVHGLVGRRPSPRLRRRHRARHATRTSTQADLIVLVGSNAAWCHPVLFQRMMQQHGASAARSIVVIDPRRTATAEEADLLLPIAPGTDTALFCGLLVHLAERGALDRAYIDAHTSGFDEALARAREIAPDVAATAARDRPRRSRRRALLRPVRSHARASSPATRRA